MADSPKDWGTQVESALAEHPDLLSQVKDIVQNEIEAVKQEFVETSSVRTSRTSSRKRKRELEWSEVLSGTGLTFVNEYINPLSLAEMNDAQINTFFQQRGAEEHKESIMSRLNEAIKGQLLPTPSNMTWTDATKILSCSISKNEAELMVDLPEVTTLDLDSHQYLDKIFTNVSEMDACIRVIFLLYNTFKDVDGIKIQAQPTFAGHTTFTDFLIRLMRNGEILLLIEVKKISIFTNLHVENNYTAQAVREAQIVLNEVNMDTKMPFILTNGVYWSVGLAQRTVENKVSVISTKNLDISVENNRKLLIQIMRKYAKC